MKPELLWESKNKRWQIYLDNGKFTIDDINTGFVFHIHISNEVIIYPSMSDIPQYVKNQFKKIQKKRKNSHERRKQH